MVKLTRWLKKRGWVVTCVVLVAVLLGVSGIQVIDRVDLGSRMGIGFDTSRTIGIGVGVDDKVITLGHIAYAAGAVDYTYDGTNDHIQFQLALNALPVTGGRLVDVSGVQKNFGATVTRAIPNVVIVGAGAGSYFTNNGVTSLFTAGGNGWKFQDLRTDAGGISMGATTRWNWENVTVASTYYAYRTPVATTGGDSWEIPVGRSATYVVAASDAPAHVKAQADYVCDGTADNVEIQAAIDALPSSGGKVFLVGGFNISGTILLNRTGITLEGESIHSGSSGGTRLILAAGSNSTMIKVRAMWVTIKNMTLWGQYALQTDGPWNGIHVELGYGAYDFRAQSVYVIGVAGAAWLLEENLAWLYDCLAEYNQKTGFDIRGSYITLIAPYSIGNGIIGYYHGYRLGGNSTLISPVAYENKGHGVEMVGANSSVIGGHFVNNGQGTHNAWSHIYITGTYNLISGVSFRTDLATKVKYAIEETGAANHNLITGNRLVAGATGTILKVGANSRVKMNRDFVTENSGTATVPNAATTVVVNHGLTTTPTRVLLTARLWSNATKVWVTNLTDTQFTINVDVDPGAGTAIFDWRAQVGEG